MNIPREAPARRVNPHKDRTGSWEPSRWSLTHCPDGRVQLPFGWASSQWGKISFSHQDGWRRSTNCCNQLINKVTTTDEGCALKINMCSTNCGVKCTHAWKRLLHISSSQCQDSVRLENVGYSADTGGGGVTRLQDESVSEIFLQVFVIFLQKSVAFATFYLFYMFLF